MYEVLTVAEYIIKRCNTQNKSISNLKLQKILYFVQAEFLVVKGERCFGAKIEAWDFGPVVPEVYHHYKIYGSATIPYSGPFYSPFTNRDQELLDGIIDECAEYSAATLVRITHNQSPWIDAYSSYSKEITPDSIREYFMNS